MMMSSYSDAVVIRHPQPGAVAVSYFPVYENSATFKARLVICIKLLLTANIYNKQSNN